ncbi:MAG: MerR family transcriptional regulator [Asticcacaulis sp.]|nr:MerR family transcriptional regulator [Asticcacaulis sp.]
MNKGPLALRTISETADILGVQQHVLRFWETKFPFIRPTKRAGGRRFYRPQDIDMLLGVKTLLYDRGYTIRGVQKLFKDEGQKAILKVNGEKTLVATEGGLVMADDVPDAVAEAGSLDTGFDLAAAQRLSQATREKFLDIARSLEEAQAALGRKLGRSVGSGKYG